MVVTFLLTPYARRTAREREERLGQEMAGDESGPVMHPALPKQLAHPGVNQRQPGAPGLPRRQFGARRAPAITSGAVVLTGGGRAGGQHLMVEIAPGHLPHEGRQPPTGPVHQLHRRDAAEMQVRREPAGPVTGQVVVSRVVVRPVVGDPVLHDFPAGGLTALGQVRRRNARADLLRCGQFAASDPGHLQFLGRAQGRAVALLLPAPEIRAEHLHVLFSESGDPAGGHDEQRVVVHLQAHPGLRQRGVQSVLPPPGVGTDVPGEVHHLGPHPLHHVQQFSFYIPAPDHQVGPDTGQRLVEVGQALRQESGPVGPVGRAAENAVIQHEQRDHPVVLPKRRVQRRIVVNAQVSGEEDDGGGVTHRTGLPPSPSRFNARLNAAY